MNCSGGRASRAAFPESAATSEDIIFKPLRFRHLTVKNRVFRSSISGRFDNEDGSLTQTRINWECKFAKGGVGAIISSYVPVADKGTDHHGLRHHPPRRFHPALADSARRPTNGGFLAPRAIPRPHHTVGVCFDTRLPQQRQQPAPLRHRPAETAKADLLT